jgi:hypothetical protein
MLRCRFGGSCGFALALASIGCARPSLGPTDSAPSTAAAPIAPTSSPPPSPSPEPYAGVEPTLVLVLGQTAALPDDAALRLRSIVPETIAPDPEGETPAGTEVVVTATFLRGGSETALVFETLSAGHTSRAIAWADEFRLTLLRTAPTRAQWLVERAHFVDTAPAQALTLRRGQAIEAGPGLEIRLVGHGHKITSVGDPPSPLLVHLQYLEQGRAAVDQHLSLEGPRPTWTFRDLHFTALAHEYDQSMDVELRRAHLQPIPPVP